MPKTLYIIDGHAQMYRAYHAGAHGRRLTSPDGEPTWATLYFFNMLLKLLDDKTPDYVLMTVDGPRKELLRSEWFPEYKAQRKPTPEDFFPQEQRILELLEAVSMPILHTKGYEADDMIATLAKTLASEELQVVIVSGDKDLAQLITPNVSLFDPKKDILFDPETLVAEKGFRPDQVIEIQTLTGDSVDNIPGIPGVGPKTALKLIHKYGTAEAVLAAAEEQTPKLRENLLAAGQKSLDLARKLVTLIDDVPVKLDLDAGAASNLNLPAAADTFAELGMNRLVDRISALTGETLEVRDDLKTTTAADFDYNLITTTEQLDAMLAEFDGCERFAFDTETTGLRVMEDKLCGISLCCKPGRAFYIPVTVGGGGLMFGQNDRLDADTVRTALAPLLANPATEKIGHNVKFDLLILRNADFEVAGPFFDTMIAAHVLDSSRPSFKLDALSNSLLRHQCIPIFELIGRGKNQITFDQVPLDAAAPYAGEDA
ncbi:MAG: hypothetical protein HN909_06800, partial [Phycisphaerales bacterium]|nr:hypothetical protein [Phycisphaerales bacterium]